MISEVDKAYAAGFFDGEGCISIAKNGAVDIRITNTALCVLTKFRDMFGGSITDRSQRVNKRQYAYNLYGDEGIEFLQTIKPYLIEKLPQAETIIEYYSLRVDLKPVRREGHRGAFTNPDRVALVETFREVLSEQKLEEH